MTNQIDSTSATQTNTLNNVNAQNQTNSALLDIMNLTTEIFKNVQQTNDILRNEIESLRLLLVKEKFEQSTLKEQINRNKIEHQEALTALQDKVKTLEDRIAQQN